MVNKSPHMFVVFQMLMNVLKEIITVSLKIIENVTTP